MRKKVGMIKLTAKHPRRILSILCILRILLRSVHFATICAFWHIARVSVCATVAMNQKPPSIAAVKNTSNRLKVRLSITLDERLAFVDSFCPALIASRFGTGNSPGNVPEFQQPSGAARIDNSRRDRRRVCSRLFDPVPRTGRRSRPAALRRSVVN